MWLGTFGVKVYNLYYDIFVGKAPADNSLITIFELDFVQKLFIVSTIFMCLLSVFYVLSKIFNKTLAFAVVSAIAVEPFYVALTRVIHLEGLMSTFLICSVVWLFYALVLADSIDPTRNKAFNIAFVLSAVFSALAILTKTSALVVLPFCGIMMFLEDFLITKRFTKSLVRSLRLYAVWL
jgi:4-amino-4-deoxy-L-arabinose transferase-like glycosyltransferase